MLAKRSVDYYLTAVIGLVFLSDLAVFLYSDSVWVVILWSLALLNFKGWICAWNHHHQHCKFFRYNWANRALELVMGLQTGVVGECWMLHHNLGHHRHYLDQTKDESAWKTPSGRTMGSLEYTLKVSALAYPKAIQVGLKYPRLLKKLVENMALTGVVLGVMAWINWVNTLILFVVPMVFLVVMTVYVTYDHHAGLDEQDPYKATYNVTDRWHNFCTCNLGYHTAHHIQCGKHWSDLPQVHEKIKHKIPPHLYREPAMQFVIMGKLERLFTRYFLTPAEEG
ncbi:MAG: fatty acid desaturase [Cyanobacteria bacterium P01_D01_bin.73]